MSSDHNKNKLSLYFPEGVLAEIRAEAERLERPLSWVAQQAWEMAKERIKAFPSVRELIQNRADAVEADRFYEGRG